MSISKINSVIAGARMRRIVKTKSLATKQNKTGIRSTGTASGRSGVISKTGSSLMDILRSMNGDTSMTGEKLAKNQSQSYEYETMRLASERVGEHLDRLLSDGEDSLFAQGEENREAVEKEISALVSDYNIMIRKLNASGEEADAGLAEKLSDEIKERASSLRRLGITRDSGGTLSLDLRTLRQADYGEIKKMFGSGSGLSKKLKTISEGVVTQAKEQISRLEKESYTLSSIYSRYGTSVSQNGTGSRYSTKG